MKRLLFLLTVGITLACGGISDSAMDAASERIAEELMEAALEQGNAGTNVEINDGELSIVGADGSTFNSKLTSEVPDGFPVSTKGMTVANVMDITSDKRMVTLTGETSDLDGLRGSVKKELLAKGFEVTVEQNGTMGELKTSNLILTKGDEVVMLVARSGDDDNTVILSWARPVE